jgi:hypothetical protein
MLKGSQFHEEFRGLRHAYAAIVGGIPRAAAT